MIQYLSPSLHRHLDMLCISISLPLHMSVDSKSPCEPFCPLSHLKPYRSDFSRMRSEGSRFIWGSGGEAVFAESCVCVRNRSQPFATVRNRFMTAVRPSTVASASGVVLKACEVDPLLSQLYWRLQRKCLCE